MQRVKAKEIFQGEYFYLKKNAHIYCFIYDIFFFDFHSKHRSPSKDQEIRKPEPKKSENELHWEELMKNMTRSLTLCDLDFTDLHSDDDKDDLMPRGLGGAVPPPPPPIGIPPPMKPMQLTLEPLSNIRQMNGSKSTAIPNTTSMKKNKKTVCFKNV